MSTAPMSVWGEIVTIAQAEQASAPALLLSTQGSVTAAWVGADESGVHHDLRVNMAETIVLPLPPVRPVPQTLYPAAVSDSVHLLWLDADYELRGDLLRATETYLFSALINGQTVERGPTRVSSRLALRYAAVADSDGSLWVAWSGGLAAEPELFLQRIDNTGRPFPAQSIALNADYPAFARANDGTLNLFWAQSGTIYHARVVEGSVQDIRTPAYTPTLNAGDRIINVSASMDNTHGYLFWNIARVAGHVETWYTSGLLDSDAWGLPRRLGITMSETSFNTGYNGGAGIAASDGEGWQAWASPLMGQYESLPVAVWDGAQLGIVYLQAGTVVGYQALVPVDVLIGTPTLLTDRDRHLYLAWAYPTLNGYADLLLTSTRR